MAFVIVLSYFSAPHHRKWYHLPTHSWQILLPQRSLPTSPDERVKPGEEEQGDVGGWGLGGGVFHLTWTHWRALSLLCILVHKLCCKYMCGWEAGFRNHSSAVYTKYKWPTRHRTRKRYKIKYQLYNLISPNWSPAEGDLAARRTCLPGSAKRGQPRWSVPGGDGVGEGGEGRLQLGPRWQAQSVNKNTSLS